MPQVAVKLYRLLHRVRRDYLKAQIPLVGIVGFHAPPTLDPRTMLAIAFRGAPVTDAAEAAQHGSDGFRALRQAQQQLQVLRSTEEETREALRHWFQLGESWARRLQLGTRSPHGGAVHDKCTEDGRSTSGISSGSAAGGGGGGSEGAGEMPARLRQLAAALEEGALLVERLYDANHLSLEEFDAEAEPADAEPEAVPAGAGTQAVAPDNVSADGGGGGSVYGGSYDDDNDLLPAPLLVPSVAATRRQLDELAAAVAAAHPGLFSYRGGTVAGRGRGGDDGDGVGDRSGSSVAGSGSAGLLRQQLEAISEELFHQRRFKHEPVEWVYDGLAPALLPQVLRRQRGIPLSLAVLYCSVARRLGVPAAPVKAAAGFGPGVSEGPATLHILPPEVAARQAGRSVALAPPLDAWLVAAVAPQSQPPSSAAPLAPSAPSPKPTTEGMGSGGIEAVTSVGVAAAPVTAAGSPGAGGGAAAAAAAAAAPTHGSVGGGGGAHGDGVLFVDVDRRGRVLDAAEARRRYADLPSAPLPQLLPASPLELWCELGRVMVTAHGRRGESDLVAHWLVQILALDHRSPEWQVMSGQ
ncbi:hypothetical protein PLESTB_000780600 [Pleodorina starrii]|uniref:Protein SirB1 N-terminal domain-containing protein n=1 Tax=Pleodorina starrii TaxID=330485 RepID=A0A9W6BL31_9CHLO|nr:hypothetical protein PLESTM_000504300 [Pleodorina starrii]GLC53725.1 hypothetical protein PLESTB_000780600 [Pleodorina starrii]GLC72907.1 hypothetical protein PLESTF_001308400 [Pleodorina starrii]